MDVSMPSIAKNTLNSCHACVHDPGDCIQEPSGWLGADHDVRLDLGAFAGAAHPYVNGKRPSSAERGGFEPRWTDSPYRFSRPAQSGKIAHEIRALLVEGTAKGTKSQWPAASAV